MLPDSELAEYARFIRKALGRTRGRELVPSLAEISALSRRQELLCTVHCPGAGACPVAIDSHTTAGDVRPQRKPLKPQPSSQLPMPGSPSAWALGLPESESHQLGNGCMWRD